MSDVQFEENANDMSFARQKFVSAKSALQRAVEFLGVPEKDVNTAFICIAIFLFLLSGIFFFQLFRAPEVTPGPYPPGYENFHRA
jgi:hypothetical protein